MISRTLAIAETLTSTYTYHLREVVDARYYYGGAAPPALCGAKLGWDTKFPLTAWGTLDHLPSKWCRNCERKGL